MKLSKRLEAIVHMASSWALQQESKVRAADVGTDHGFVPICLIERGIAAHAFALDVREGPLLRAKEHVRERGLTDQIDLRLGDGLTPLVRGEADLVIISGMGGELMLRILKEGSLVRDSIKGWIFSPQSEIAMFRRGLKELELSIKEEEMIQEDGKFYVVMTAEKSSDESPAYADGTDREYEYLYGKRLIEKKDPVLGEFLKREEKQLATLWEHLKNQEGQKAGERLKEVEKKLEEVRKVEKLFFENLSEE